MLRNVLFLSACLVVAVPGRPQAVFANSAAHRYQAGVEAFKGGDLYRAAVAFEEALESAPSHVGAHFALAQAYHGLYERLGLFYQEAVQHYIWVVDTIDEDMSADHPRQMARLLLGRLHVEGGAYAAGTVHLKTFLDLVPDYYAREEVWNTLGVAYYYLDRYEEAVHAFEQALQDDPAHSPARFNLRSVFTRISLFDVAMANHRAQRPDLALRDLDHLIELAPRYLPARIQKAIILRSTGKVAEAEIEAHRALALAGGADPKTRFALHEFLGDLLGFQGKTEEALTHYGKCLRIFPGYLQVVEKMNALEDPTKRSPAEQSGSAAPVRPAIETPVNQFPM